MSKFDLNKELHRSLSSNDIKKLLNLKVKILLYPDIVDYHNIDDLLKPYDCVVILYMHNKIKNGYYGHWCCIFKIDNENIEFFDPYGIFPDDQLDFSISTYFRIENGLQYPLLTYLLFYTGSKYKLSYNEYKFQGNDVATCGRHCAVRLLNKHLSLKEYKKKMDSYKKNYDIIVTIITNNILNRYYSYE